MTGGGSGRRDLVGWLAAAGVAAALFAGAAAAALRAGPGAAGAGAVAAVPLDLSVGVVPLSAVPAVEMDARVQAQALQAEAAPDAQPALSTPDPEPVVIPRNNLPVSNLPRPALDLPQADVPPVMVAPPPLEEPPLDIAQSPRPVARPDRRRADEKVKPEEWQAQAPRPSAPWPLAEPDPAAAPRTQAQAAQPVGSDQAAQPAQERQVTRGQEAARYGDTVMHQIAKLRRKKAPDRGVVTVGFEIGGDGGLLRVAVVSSSGSAALDQVAVDHIRRAAPFPPPPEGATTWFGFEFVGK
jgi:periplasmic protein TonB